MACNYSSNATDQLVALDISPITSKLLKFIRVSKCTNAIPLKTINICYLATLFENFFLQSPFIDEDHRLYDITQRPI